MKAAGPATAFEAGLYALLAREAPDEVLAPIALDPARGWMLLPDGGPPLDELPPEALGQYGRLQRALAPHADGLPALGVPDMRPEVMPARFEEALDAARASAPAGGGDEGALARVEALRDDVARWCERLAASPVPASLDHNDLHQQNVLGSGPYRFYDWGDAVVAHAFAALLVPSQVLSGEPLRARPRRLPGGVRRPRPARSSSPRSSRSPAASRGSPARSPGSARCARPASRTSRSTRSSPTPPTRSSRRCSAEALRRSSRRRSARARAPGTGGRWRRRPGR